MASIRYCASTDVSSLLYYITPTFFSLLCLLRVHHGSIASTSSQFVCGIRLWLWLWLWLHLCLCLWPRLRPRLCLWLFAPRCSTLAAIAYAP